MPAASPFTRSASSSRSSAPSTSVKAAQLSTTSGAASATAPRTALGVGHVELRTRERHRVVAQDVHDVLAEHPGRPHHQRPHRICTSALSPSTKR